MYIYDTNKDIGVVIINTMFVHPHATCTKISAPPMVLHWLLTWLKIWVGRINKLFIEHSDLIEH